MPVSMVKVTKGNSHGFALERPGSISGEMSCGVSLLSLAQFSFDLLTPDMGLCGT